MSELGRCRHLLVDVGIPTSTSKCRHLPSSDIYYDIYTLSEVIVKYQSYMHLITFDR